MRQDKQGGGTMAKTAIIRARTEPKIKADAERVFRKLGMTSTEAITMFYAQVRLHNGLPFPVEIPNAVTRQTFEKTDRGEDLHDYPSLDDFFKKMGA
jgi:DNA-damage-inducible protein J